MQLLYSRLLDGYQRWNILYHHSPFFFQDFFKAPSGTFQIQSIGNDVSTLSTFTLMRSSSLDFDESSYEFKLTGFLYTSCGEFNLFQYVQLYPVPAGLLVPTLITLRSANCHRFCFGRGKLRRCYCPIVGGGFSRFQHAWITTKFVHPSLTKVRPSRILCITDNGTSHSQHVDVDHQKGQLVYDPRIPFKPRISAVSCTRLSISSSVVFTQFQTKCHVIVHSHVGKERSFGIPMAISRSLGDQYVVYNRTIDGTFHLLWYLQDQRSYEESLIYHILKDLRKR